MQSGKVEIKFHDKAVFTMLQQDSEAGEFPGNSTDSQFHSTTDNKDQDMSKYSCSYTGKHDHGDLHAQQRSATVHEPTLQFLAQARAGVEKYFIENKPIT